MNMHAKLSLDPPQHPFQNCPCLYQHKVWPRRYGSQLTLDYLRLRTFAALLQPA